jgi:hypothetical protein
MTRFAVAYAATAVVFCGLDFLWLGFVAKGYYQSQVGALLLDKPNLAVAALFYGLYIVGVLIFSVLPALDAGAEGRAVRLLCVRHLRSHPPRHAEGLVAGNRDAGPWLGRRRDRTFRDRGLSCHEGGAVAARRIQRSYGTFAPWHCGTLPQ